MSAYVNPWVGRHPSVAHFEPLFSYTHLPPFLAAVSETFAKAAEYALSACKDGPELSAGLRKLLEAKDCVVRQAVIDQKKLGE